MTTNFTAKCLAVQTYGGYTAGQTYTLNQSVYGPLVAQGVLQVVDILPYQLPFAANDLALQTVYVPLAAGDATAATANTAMLNTLAASLANTGSRLNIVFPDGDIYYNGVVSWKSYLNQPQTTTSILSTAEAEWPEFSSNGTTNFRWTGGQIDGATWTFSQGTAATQATKLRMKKIRFIGPGVSVNSTTASVAVSAAATSVTVASAANINIGCAIAISANALTGGSVVPTSFPWWATVTGIAGNVVTFAPATPANFAASIGNVVQIFRQVRAIQIGAINPSIQDVNFYTVFDDVSFVDWFTGVAGHDVTGLKFTNSCTWNRCMYGFEGGYNIDSVRFEQPQMIDQLTSQSGTVSTGVATITGLSGTGSFKPGMALSDVTAPATAQAFPEWACIQSVDSSTQVTMTHNSTLTGTRTFQPMMGVLAAQGSGGSPFYPRSLVGDGSRANGDQWYFGHSIMNQCKAMYTTDSNNNSSIVAEDSYIELCQRFAIIGNQGGVNSQGPYVFRRAILSDATKFTGTPIESYGSGVLAEVSDFQGAGNLPFFLFRSQNGGANGSISIARNNVPCTATGLFSPNTFYFNGITPAANAVGVIDIATAQPSGLVANITAAGATTNQETDGWDGVNISLTANTTLANSPSGAPRKGKRYRITVTENATGGFTFSLGTNFVDQAGTALASRIAAGTANKVCVMDFIGDGARFILVGGTLTAGLPVFI